MVVHEFGKEHDRHFLLFQGSCEPWKEFLPAAELLAKEYHVILLTPDGHDPDDHTDFISVERTVDQAVEWLRAHSIDRLDGIYGLSFGGGMVTRFLTTQSIPVGKAIIDAGTAPYECPKWVAGLICCKDYLMIPLARMSVKMMGFAFPPERFAHDPEKAEQEYEEIRRYLKTFSRKTIWNIFWSANNYSVPKTAPDIKTQIQFWVGTDELRTRSRDLKWYKKYLPQIEVVMIPDMMHMEYILMHPEAFAEQALAFLGQEPQHMA